MSRLQNRPYRLFILLLQPHFTMRRSIFYLLFCILTYCYLLRSFGQHDLSLHDNHLKNPMPRQNELCFMRTPD